MDLASHAFFKPICVLLIIIAGFTFQSWISCRVASVAQLKTPEGDTLVVPNNIFPQRFVKVEPAGRSHSTSS